MTRNIKITERQYQMLENLNEEEYSYLNKDDNTKPYTGYNEISPDGKNMDGITPPEKRTTGDKIQQMRTMDGWNRYRTYGNITPTTVREGITTKSLNQSNDFYDVGGFNNKELNTLTNDNDKDNLVKIPYSIEQRLNILLDLIKQMNLSPKQQGIILNKVIETLDYDAIPNQWKKEMINDLK